MDRETKKALRAQQTDWQVQANLMKRRADQVAAMPEPEYPATGTARIAALLAEARATRRFV